MRARVPEEVMVHARRVERWKSWMRALGYTGFLHAALQAYACDRRVRGELGLPYDVALLATMIILLGAGFFVVHRARLAYRDYQRAEAAWQQETI